MTAADRNRVSLLVLPCPSLSVKENDYESEGRRFESCRAHHRNPAKRRKLISFGEVTRRYWQQKASNSNNVTVDTDLYQFPWRGYQAIVFTIPDSLVSETGLSSGN